MEDTQIAAALGAQLAARIGAQRYELWFGPSTRLCVGPGCLTIRAASAFVRDWLRTNFADDIRACWEAIVGRALPIAFEVDEAMAAGAAAAEDRCVAKPQATCGADGESAAATASVVSGQRSGISRV
jgi:chromosomal replication initiation ATPase DnaA